MNMIKKKLSKPFKIKILDLDAGKYIVIMNQDDADCIGLNKEDRIRISFDHRKITAIVDITNSVVKSGEIGVFKNVQKALKLGDESSIEVVPTDKPISVELINKKMNGGELTGE